jgi:phosphate/sulfate permease
LIRIKRLIHKKKKKKERKRKKKEKKKKRRKVSNSSWLGLAQIYLGKFMPCLSLM